MNSVIHCLLTIIITRYAWKNFIFNVKNRVILCNYFYETDVVPTEFIFVSQNFISQVYKDASFFPFMKMYWILLKFQINIKIPEFWFTKYASTLIRHIFLFEIYLYFKSSLS